MPGEGGENRGTFIDNPMVQELINKLKRRQLNSKECAIGTVEALRSVIGATKGNNPARILEEVRAVGRELVRAQPTELTVGNMVRRILFIIREEYETQAASEANDAGEREGGIMQRHQPSLHNVLEGELAMQDTGIWSKQMPVNFKQNVNQSIKEVVDEIEGIQDQIADQAMEHIHANEVILTSNYSVTVLHFLKEVKSKGRKFEVVVAESAPVMDGHKMAQLLAKAGISTTVISDAAIFALMARVNKVIVGCSAVLANGGIISHVGMHNIALAAKHHSVPFVVCTGMFKLSPTFPHDQYSLSELQSPASISGSGADSIDRSVRVLNPKTDYIPPQLIDLFLTNAGGHNPSYIYRLLAEYYSMQDQSLD
uniref:Translation initiation factor eIF2B subunit beta n=1 Tax=Hemiselmis andersenii TaxID=464988 RepID=A0A6U4LTB6_HEMAN|mmetsp:Transcript_26932/g.62419  ORF Transcript_26932/g.62419 Transcript_26932/m.62419 type:complete len:369 (+) Transcript_26932:27-1133(+)|eukprot:CAMPEP_0169446316 /NCGR_PEP_ID=MMETSP1042-20121227/10910_1 /TAXON_ID=464988 /ORGANISM="Hemiselmis andersenii, Strain CCMP1180" /LENGTH=368 /DNA_ID=CAMNT_0009557775 /DNA_START=35 /DNA_END=1141 /DNA_ORIENTATION=+